MRLNFRLTWLRRKELVLQNSVAMIIKPKTSYTIRLNDCDPYNHLNNVKYIDYFQAARADHLINFYNYDMNEYRTTGIGYVVGNHQIFYFKPAVGYEHVKIQSSVIEIQEFKVLVEFIMWNDTETEIKCILWTEYFGYNLKSGKMASLPEANYRFFKETLNTEVNVADGIMKRYKDLKK